MSEAGAQNAQEVLNSGRMGWRQWLAIAVTVSLNALDGIDVLSVSYAAPGIAAEWALPPSTMGWILSMELLGMALGSIGLGSLADRVGRRATILTSLVVMAIGMLGASHAAGVTQLLAWRLLTGLGIGGMLPAINAAAAELSNQRWRNLAMALMVIGYPLGGVIGGLGVQALYANGGNWRTVFELGSLLTIAFVPIVVLTLSETPAWFDKSGKLDAANRALARMGHRAADVLSAPITVSRSQFGELLRPPLRATTLLVTLVYFLHVTSFYFMIKWTPKIVSGLGYEPSQAAGTLTYANLGGALGGALLGLLAVRISIKQVAAWALIGTFLTIGTMGWCAHELWQLQTLVFGAGFFGNAGIAGLYLLFASVFPTQVRATGSGFAIGVGRGGAILAPIIAGYLFSANLSLTWVAAALACGSLVAAIALRSLREQTAE